MAPAPGGPRSGRPPANCSVRSAGPRRPPAPPCEPRSPPVRVFAPTERLADLQAAADDVKEAGAIAEIEWTTLGSDEPVRVEVVLAGT